MRSVVSWKKMFFCIESVTNDVKVKDLRSCKKTFERFSSANWLKVMLHAWNLTLLPNTGALAVSNTIRSHPHEQASTNVNFQFSPFTEYNGAKYFLKKPLTFSRGIFQTFPNIYIYYLGIRHKYYSLFYPEALQVLNFLSWVLDRLIVDLLMLGSWSAVLFCISFSN